METSRGKKIVVGLSGASGVLYGQRLVDVLEKSGCEAHVIVTDIARQLLVDEIGINELNPDRFIGRQSKRVFFYDNSDMFSSLASGSCRIDGMAICPCSTHSLSAIAAGLANTLLLRTAYVQLKQRRRLVLVHREIPLTQIDLENMLRITSAGGIICPASPAFYMTPETINDLVDSLVGRVIDLLGIEHDLPVRWSP